MNLFEDEDDILDIARRNQVQNERQSLLAHFRIRSGEHSKYIHDQLL